MAYTIETMPGEETGYLVRSPAGKVIADRLSFPIAREIAELYASSRSKRPAPVNRVR